jgi:hypothetical protein
MRARALIAFAGDFYTKALDLRSSVSAGYCEPVAGRSRSATQDAAFVLDLTQRKRLASSHIPKRTHPGAHIAEAYRAPDQSRGTPISALIEWGPE